VLKASKDSKINTRGRQEIAIETRSIIWGELTDVGTSIRAKKA
jgi:hypothetical protein